MRFIGQIDVFQVCCGPTIFNLLAQFGRQFALFLDGVENGCFAVVQLYESGVLIGNSGYLDFVQGTRFFLAVTGNKRYRRLVVQ